GASLSPLGRHEPAARRPRVRAHGGLRAADPAWPLHLRLRRPGGPARLVRQRPGAAQVPRGPLLGRRLPGRADHPGHVGGFAAVFVEGTVRNVGSRPSRDVQVTVEGLDASGARVVSADTLPTPQAIPPDTSATFVVRLPNDPAVRTYHVVAIGR